LLTTSRTLPIATVESDYGDQATAVATAAPSRDGSREFTPGTVVADRYRVVSLLGRGGMGEVYAADDLKLGQRVALKFLPTQYGKNQNWRELFVRGSAYGAASLPP